MADVSSIPADQLEQILRIDRLIRAGQARSTNQLTRALGTSPASIQRALLALRDTFKAPLVVDKARGFVYKDNKWQMPPLPLTSGELFALIAGNRLLVDAEGTLYIEELQRHIERLVDLLPRRQWLDLNALSDVLYLRTVSPTSLDWDLWKQLCDACNSGQQIFISASDEGGTVTNRVVDPYLVHVWRGHKPYLIAYEPALSDFKLFPVSDIRTLSTIGQRFERNPAFDAQSLIEKIGERETKLPSLRVSILFSPEAGTRVRTRLVHPSQQIVVLPDGAVRLQLQVNELESIKRWVLGFGSAAVVEEPTQLIDAIRTDLTRLAKTYKIEGL